MRTVLAVTIAVALAVTGCKNDFTPQSDLTGPRVLAIVADPLELLPAETVTLSAEEWLPDPAAPTTRRWTFCPVSAGAVAGYACAVHGPACEVEIGADTPGPVTANPTALIAGCLASLGTSPSAFPAQVTTLFRYELTVAGAAPRESILQLPQWTVAPPSGWERNLPPVIQAVEIGGQPAASAPSLPVGGSLPVRLVIDPASVQSYLDAAGVLQEETMTGYFYTTAGTFKDGITTGLDTTVELQGTGLQAGQAPLQIWVVALDLRGGQAVAGPFTVPVGP